MKKPAYIIILFFLSLSSVWAQQRQFTNSIGLKVGAGSMLMRDQWISTFAYQGTSPNVIIEYKMITDKIRSTASLGFTGADLKTDMLKGYKYGGEFESDIPDKVNGLTKDMVQISTFNFGYDFMYKLNDSSNSKWSFFLGAKVNYNQITKKYLILDHQNRITETYFNLAPSFRIEFLPSFRHRLSHTFDLPLFGRSGRMNEYNLKPNFPDLFKSDRYIMTEEVKGGSSLGSYLAFTFTIEYNFYFARRWSLDAAYVFNYYQYTQPEKVQTASQYLLVGVSFLF